VDGCHIHTKSDKQVKQYVPRFILPVAFSGQIQHLVGMQSSKIIVAINQDSHAPIFDVATYGIVGDLFQIVPLLTKEFKKTRAK